MKSDLNKIDAKLLLVSLFSTLSFIATIILLFWELSSYFSYYLMYLETNNFITEFMSTIIVGGIWLIFSIYTSIQLLAIKLNNIWCKRYKVLFGLISLFLCLSFFSLIFVFIAKHKINKERKESGNYNDYSNENIITKNFDFNKLKSYRTKSWISPLFIVVFVIFIVVAAANLDFRTEFIPGSSTNIGSVFLMLCIAAGSNYLIFNTSISLSIIFSSWDIDWCRKNRILFGLLSLIFSFITILIFTNTGLKKAEKQLHEFTREINDSYNNNYNQQINQQPFQNNYPNFSDPNFNQNNNNNSISKPIVENYDDYDENAQSKAGEVASTVAEAAGSVLEAIGDFLGSL
ncbi:MAG: hypothetical protein K2I49_01950 [Ureaplasma sp.]|nr:hypothetical protein [Ureaplasma sp.]